jgi:hypothetical protein
MLGSFVRMRNRHLQVCPCHRVDLACMRFRFCLCVCSLCFSPALRACGTGPVSDTPFPVCTARPVARAESCWSESSSDARILKLSPPHPFRVCTLTVVACVGSSELSTARTASVNTTRRRVASMRTTARCRWSGHSRKYCLHEQEVATIHKLTC